MLTERTLNEAEILARDLTARGIRLNLLPDNPLFDLTVNSTPMEKVFSNPFEAVKATSNASSSVNFNGTISHSEDLKKYAWGLGQSLNRTMDIARNTINPMVREVTDLIEKRIDTEIFFNVGINIKSYFLPEIMKNGNLDDLTDRYKSVIYSQVDWNNETWPVMTAQFLRDSAKGKSNKLDKQITVLLESVPDDLVVGIYNYLFRLSVLPNPDIDENVVYILGFLWTMTWYNDLPSGLNSNLKQLSLDLTSLKSNCGKHIQDNLKRFDRMSNQNYFILKSPNVSLDRKTFIVQGEIYNQWLKTGGSPELLIGSWLSNDSTAINNIDDQKRTEWLRRYRLDSEIRRQEFDTRRQTLITKELSDFVDDSIKEKGMDYSKVRQSFNGLIKNRPYRVNKDLAEWVRMVLCNSLYPDTDILTVLNSIDEVMGKTEDTPPREAATAAAIDLVVDWLYSAIKVEFVEV